jgi:SnoaL-like domain
MRGAPAREPNSPWLKRPGRVSPSLSGIVSWSESNDSPTATRALPGHVFGASERPARTRSTAPRHVPSSQRQGVAASVSSMTRSRAAQQACHSSEGNGAHHSGRVYAGKVTARRAFAAGLGALLVTLVPFAPASAQEWDPRAAVAAYSSALETRDLNAALALFDEYGSATDALGKHYEGRSGLTAFLLESGFSQSGMRITTQKLHVVGNRAAWTYTCSCASGVSEARLVLNHDKISVFFVMPQPAPPPSPPSTDLGPWAVAAAALAAAIAAGRGLRGRREPPSLPSLQQGRLLVALARAHQQHPPAPTSSAEAPSR